MTDATQEFGLKGETLLAIREVLASFPAIESATIFGSRAKGQHHEASDIDLALFGGPALDLRVLYRVMDALDELLLPYSFDLILFSTVGDPDVRDHILRVGLPFFDRESPTAPH
jgi:predicted nucleotidyltransferase